MIEAFLDWNLFNHQNSQIFICPISLPSHVFYFIMNLILRVNSWEAWITSYFCTWFRMMFWMAISEQKIEAFDPIFLEKWIGFSNWLADYVMNIASSSRLIFFAMGSQNSLDSFYILKASNSILLSEILDLCTNSLCGWNKTSTPNSMSPWVNVDKKTALKHFVHDSTVVCRPKWTCILSMSHATHVSRHAGSCTSFTVRSIEGLQSRHMPSVLFILPKAKSRCTHKRTD